MDKHLKNTGLKDYEIIDCSGLSHIWVGIGPPTFPTGDMELNVEVRTDTLPISQGKK